MDQEINDAGDYVFGIFKLFMNKLDTNYENLVDCEGRNIIDYPSIAIELTKIVVAELKGA